MLVNGEIWGNLGKSADLGGLGRSGMVWKLGRSWDWEGVGRSREFWRLGIGLGMSGKVC